MNFGHDAGSDIFDPWECHIDLKVNVGSPTQLRSLHLRDNLQIVFIVLMLSDRGITEDDLPPAGTDDEVENIFFRGHGIEIALGRAVAHLGATGMTVDQVAWSNAAKVQLPDYPDTRQLLYDFNLTCIHQLLDHFRMLDRMWSRVVSETADSGFPLAARNWAQPSYFRDDLTKMRDAIQHLDERLPGRVSTGTNAGKYARLLIQPNDSEGHVWGFHQGEDGLWEFNTPPTKQHPDGETRRVDLSGASLNRVVAAIAYGIDYFETIIGRFTRFRAMGNKIETAAVMARNSFPTADD